MSNYETPWNAKDALKPAILGTLLMLDGLMILSSPRPLTANGTLIWTIVLGYYAFQTSGALFPDSQAEENYLRFLLLFGIHLSYLVFLRDDANLHATVIARENNRLKRAWKLLFNFRGVGTSWEIHSLHRSQSPLSSTEKDKISQPIYHSRSFRSALLVRTGYLTLNFLLLCIYYEFVEISSRLNTSPSDYTPEKETLIRRLVHASDAQITQRELFIRLSMVMNFIVPVYLTGSAYHDFAALICIGIGIDEDWEWPSVFGSLSDVYSMRGFWGSFWHRLIYRSFSAHAAALTNWLGFKQRTPWTRLLNNTLVFASSAVMHSIVSWKMGNQCAWNRSMAFWILQPVAFIVEGMVQAGWKRMCDGIGFRADNLARVVLERLVGYLWVFAWFFWSAPKRSFPLAFCN